MKIKKIVLVVMLASSMLVSLVGCSTINENNNIAQ